MKVNVGEVELSPARMVGILGVGETLRFYRARRA